MLDQAPVSNKPRFRPFSIADVFAHAKGPKFGSADSESTLTVSATYIDYEPHSHPNADKTTNPARYANGARYATCARRRSGSSQSPAPCELAGCL